MHTTDFSKVHWDDRYSETMEDDEYGRWARVAITGNLKAGFIGHRPAIFEIAWVKKIPGFSKFSINYSFPCTAGIVANSLDEAKKMVEDEFKHFVDTLTGANNKKK